MHKDEINQLVLFKLADILALLGHDVEADAIHAKLEGEGFFIANDGDAGG
jgi:hypothetical protein